MHSPRKTIIWLILAATTLAFAAGAQAEEESAKGWTPGFGLRLLGLDLDFTTDIPALLPVGKTEFHVALGGGYVGRGFYRNADGTRADAPNGAIDYIDADVWLKGTQYLDKASLLRASLWLRGQSLQNARDSGGEPSLLALSGLPEASGAAELGAGAALGYTDYRRKTSAEQETGVKADLSYEFSFEYYPAAMSSGLVHEFAAEFSGFLPLVDTPDVSLVLGEHLLASALFGSSVPEFRRSGLGGNRFSPYKALGGIVRGVPDNYGDGLLKVGENLELRIAFPSLFKGIVIPGVTVFADAGLADDGAYGADLDTFRVSSGAIATIRTLGFTLGGGAVYEFTQGYFGPYIALGTQF